MLKFLGVFAIFFSLTTARAATQITTLKILKSESGEYTLLSKSVNSHAEGVTGIETASLEVHEYPQFIVEHQHSAFGPRIIEITSQSESQITDWLASHHVLPMVNSHKSLVQDEVRTIINGGPTANRIDLVFMGDGYTESEREKFFSDITRLVNDMFIGKTFTSYLPIFNVHAVFRASSVSGIGHGSSINTAYGLYREGETLRASYPGNGAAIRESCRQAPACDYPVVIANDPYSGGLGGEFAISTSSPTSGTVVLRHELGHNFGLVGEEYDGGGYFGANHSTSFSSPSWKDWATDRGAIRAEPMVARHLSWPWQKLDRGSFTANMSSNGEYAVTRIRISASGIETPDTLSIKLDDQEIEFDSPNRLDRSFVNIEVPNLSSGPHKLVFKENIADHNNWLSSLTVHEYARDFHGDPEYLGAFPNFAEDLSLDGYRPTDESCLMRNMTHEFFCSVCQENNWGNFFKKITLIDQFSAVRSQSAVGTPTINAELKVLSLGQFRTAGSGAPGETLEIQWFGDGQELTEYRGQTKISFEPRVVISSLKVKVSLKTPELRTKNVTNEKQVSL